MKKSQIESLKSPSFKRKKLYHLNQLIQSQDLVQAVTMKNKLLDLCLIYKINQKKKIKYQKDSYLQLTNLMKFPNNCKKWPIHLLLLAEQELFTEKATLLLSSIFKTKHLMIQQKTLQDLFLISRYSSLPILIALSFG